jgi:hypothetical protein
VFPRNFSKVNFNIDEAIIASLKKILDVPVLLSKLFKAGKCIVDLMLVKFD